MNALTAGLMVAAAVALWNGVHVPMPHVRWRGFRSKDDPARTWVRLVDAIADELRAGATVAVAWMSGATQAGVILDPRDGAGFAAALAPVANRDRLPEVAQLGVALDVAHASGASLDETLTHIADALRARMEDRALVEQELASTKATVVVLACLPLVGAVLSVGLGAGSLQWLTGNGLGRLCLAGGLTLQFAGTWWVRRMVKAVAV